MNLVLDNFIEIETLKEESDISYPYMNFQLFLFVCNYIGNLSGTHDSFNQSLSDSDENDHLFVELN